MDPDPAAPYQTIYAAAEFLRSLEQRAAAIAETDPANQAAADCADRLRLERGLLLLQTDMLCEGEPIVSDVLQRSKPWPLWESLRAHNALGALWCDRDNGQLALQHLEAAQTLYNAAQQASSSGRAVTGPSTATAAAAAATDEPRWAAAFQPAGLAAAIEAEYTQTCE